jgi:type I restriction enzyme S subunit
MQETKVLHKKNLLVPKLRFKGFDDFWANEKIGDIINNKSSKYNPEKAKESFKCIELEHLSTSTGDLLGYIDSINSASIKNKFNAGDVLFGKLRPYLRKYLIAPFEGVCSSEIWVLKGEKITNEFLYQIVQSDFFINLANQSTGSKMPRADWNVVASGMFNFPSLPEQQKIASFLSAVDEKIQLLNKKKQLLEQYKKGVMQQLFSGKLRFKDENGKIYPKWEEKKLGEIGDTFNGLTGKTKEHFGEGKPYIQYMQIFANAKIDITKCGLVQIDKNENQPRVEYGDIFFTTSSETPNEIGTCSVLLDTTEEMYLNSFCFGFRANSLEQLVPNFAAYLFRNEIFREKIIRLAQGSTRYNMSKVQFLKLKIALPNSKEQKKIADFLSAIDVKIESLSNQINQTQNFKKGLLQQMFV